jgi:hypothetical protein
LHPRTPGWHLSHETVLRIPAIRVAVVLSLLLHAAVLWGWVPRPHDSLSDRAGSGKGSGPLAVRLETPPSSTPSAATAPAESSALPAPPPPAKHASPPAAKRASPPAPPRPRPAPQVVAKDGPAIARAPPEPPAAAPAPAPIEGDFSAYLEARRRARGAAPEEHATSEPLVEDERARHNRIVAENLGLNRTPTYGREPPGGGIFRIERIGYTEAEFTFFGWNKDIRRRSRQLIVVEKGANSDIRVAVVRRMIAIIREHSTGDFLWMSPRLGREITLSARAADNAGLEDFLMQEFFPEWRPG